MAQQQQANPAQRETHKEEKIADAAVDWFDSNPCFFGK